MHDALGKTLDLPVYELSGGAPDNDPTIDLHYSVGIKSPGEVRKEARKACEAGYTSFKIKVGGPDFEIERNTVALIVETVPDAKIRSTRIRGGPSRTP
ncbi:hypothetical protein BG842_06265 [Haladaptatus sp. W1]|nr:hypothetical protein BG842_06265 [Haladaptatus sp. W1]